MRMKETNLCASNQCEDNHCFHHIDFRRDKYLHVVYINEEIIKCNSTVVDRKIDENQKVSDFNCLKKKACAAPP